METTPNNVLDREPQLSDLTIQGLRYYEDSLKDVLERDHYGAVVAIQPYSGEYERQVQAVILEEHPLIGFKLLNGYHLSIEMREEGDVTIEEL